MSKRTPIGRRPGEVKEVERWVRGGENGASPEQAAEANPYTARLTIDVTPQLRGRIKIVAFKRDITVMEMLRAMLEREYGNVGNER